MVVLVAVVASVVGDMGVMARVTETALSVTTRTNSWRWIILYDDIYSEIYIYCDLGLQLRQRCSTQERENQELRSKVFKQEEQLFDLSATMATFEVEVKTQADQKFKNINSELGFKVG
jgi:anti-sigma-K factor RskA